MVNGIRKVKQEKQTKQENAEPKDTQEKPAPKDKTIVPMENDFEPEDVAWLAWPEQKLCAF